VFIAKVTHVNHICGMPNKKKNLEYDQSLKRTIATVSQHKAVIKISQLPRVWNRRRGQWRQNHVNHRRKTFNAFYL